MSNRKSVEARELTRERRNQERARTVERAAARAGKGATVRAFGGVK